jgi:predicted porin
MNWQTSPQVKSFVEAILSNARTKWDSPDDEGFVEKLLYIRQEGDVIEVSDNFERFFDTIYQYNVVTDTWRLRYGYSDKPEKAYSYEKAMSDASIMYTG